ncbi:MAG: SufB/SufD family protein, partial [Actinomycetes bacterium]
MSAAPQPLKSVIDERVEVSAPSTSDEEWRYSRIGELDLARWTVPTEPGSTAVDLSDVIAAAGAGASVVQVRDGFVVDVQVHADAEAAGVRIGTASELGDVVQPGAVMSTPTDLFAALNTAVTPDAVVVDVPRGCDAPGPVVVLSSTTIDGATVAPRLVVRAGENASVTVIEVQSSADVAALVAPVTEIEVGPAARVRYSVLQDLGPRVWQIGTLATSVDRDGTLHAGIAALGGEYARLRTDCRLAGPGASGNLSSVYFAEGEQMLDLRTFQLHDAPHTNSNLLFKGAVADAAHSVYTGMIRIGHEARGANAFQTNRNLKLSEQAWAESVPNLEIEHNDVRCSHASMVGPVDEDQRFYLE